MSASLPASDPELMSGPGPTADPYDPDHLLARYRATRIQAALFDVRGGQAGRAAGYDELIDGDGRIRPAWRPLAEAIGGAY